MIMASKIQGRALLSVIATLNSVSMAWFGYDQGVFSGVLISADFKQHFPAISNPNISGITSSCFSLGAFIGCLVAFVVGDKLGRKKTILLGITCNIIGAVLQISAYQLPQMIIGRIVNGFGMGVTSSTCPVYMAECSPINIRGRLVALGSVCNTVAVCLATWINYGLYGAAGPFQWRFPLAFQLVFPVFVLSCFPFACESPRWLLLKGRQRDSLEALARLQGFGNDLNNADLVYEFKSIVRALEEEKLDRAPALDILRFRDNTQKLKRLILSCGTQLMQQFSGVNALGYYLPTLLQQSVGVSSTQSRLLTAANATIYLLAAFVCLLLIDRVGRRKLMLYGSATMGSWYLIAAITLQQAGVHPGQKQTLGRVTTSMFFLYYFCYGTSFAKVPWVFDSEINSLSWRTRGAAAATATNWMGSFIVTQFTQVGVNNLGWRFYLLFSVFCYMFFPVVYCFYPETCRRSLEDMDEIFRSNPGPFVCFNKTLTQRGRPDRYIEVEIARTQHAAMQDIQARN